MFIAGILSLFLAIFGWGFWRVQHPAPTPTRSGSEPRKAFGPAGMNRSSKTWIGLSRLRAPTASDWFLRAELAAIQDHLDDAIADLEQVPDEHPFAAQGRLIAGQVERRRDRLRYAEQALLDAIRLDPSLVQAHRELIRIYGIQLRRPEFNREFQALKRLVVLSFDDVYHWTSVRNNLWEPGAVVEDLMRFVAADPSDRWTQLALADIFRRMGLLTEAKSTLDGFPQDDPEATAIRVQMALDSQNENEAERLLASGPTRPPCPRTFARSGRPCSRECRELHCAFSNRLRRRSRRSGDRKWNARRVFDQLGNEAEAKFFREAAANLGRLNSLLPRGGVQGARNDLDLIREFGITCAALHRDDEARAWIELAIAANPLDSKSQQLMHKLGSPERPRPDEGQRKP